MLAKLTTAILTLAVSGLIAFDSTAAAPATKVAITTIDKGDSSCVPKSDTAVVKTDAEWTQLWDRHSGGLGQAQPQVDFTKEMVLGVFLGTKPKAGFKVEIVKVEDDGANLIVSYRETKPTGGLATFVSPFHLVKVPANTRTIKFQSVP